MQLLEVSENQLLSLKKFLKLPKSLRNDIAKANIQHVSVFGRVPGTFSAPFHGTVRLARNHSNEKRKNPLSRSGVIARS